MYPMTLNSRDQRGDRSSFHPKVCQLQELWHHNDRGRTLPPPVQDAPPLTQNATGGGYLG